MEFVQKYRALLRALLALVTSFILVKAIGNGTSFADTLYKPINQFFGRILHGFSSWSGFSLGDVFYTILGLFALVFLAQLIRLIIQKKYKFVYKQFVQLIWFLFGFFWVFHLIWGFNYYKTPIKEAYNVEVDTLDELKELAGYYYEKAAYYRELVEEDERGVFKKSLSRAELNDAIQQSVKQIENKYPEIRFYQTFDANLKPSFYSELTSHLGILGYYNPFTNEAQYNTKMPDSKVLFTELHETAHQYGFAFENEANFVGFLMGMESEEVDLLYISHFKAMRSLLNRILWLDPEFVKDYIENKYTPGMQRDREYELEVMERYTGKSEDVFSLMNEAFLKLNNQEGLESYGRFVELLVGFNREYPH